MRGKETLGTFQTNAVNMLEHCQQQIDGGDIDVDDWLYRTRDVSLDYVRGMEAIGYRMERLDETRPKWRWWR